MEIKTTIKTGEYEIISSGQFTCLSEEETILELKHESETIKIVFNFKNDEGKSRFSGNIINEEYIKLDLINFNDPVSQGTIDLIEIGSFFQKKIFFSFRVFNLEDKKLRTLSYTFYAI